MENLLFFGVPILKHIRVSLNYPCNPFLSGVLIAALILKGTYHAFTDINKNNYLRESS